MKLARLRIGHSRLTYGYHMSTGRLPECEHCLDLLTVTHSLIDCPETQNMRTQMKLPVRLKDLLGADCPATLPQYHFDQVIPNGL